MNPALKLPEISNKCIKRKETLLLTSGIMESLPIII